MARESAVRMIVAVERDGTVSPPSGSCRELLWQIDRHNTADWVISGKGEGACLADLLPRR